MRYKDDDKNDKIVESAIQLINEIGLAETSMSKIAKKAGVAPGTIYTYFDNKEDMLKSLFLIAKKDMQQKVLRGINISSPTESEFKLLVRNFIHFFSNNKENSLFMEQFMNSPLILKMDADESKILRSPIVEFFENGKSNAVFKQIDVDLMFIYAISPLTQIAKKHYNGEFEFTEANVDTIVQMSWIAIRS
ncbi:TetR family transcriptional regulator [Clostridia bacterium]|nr:TetR family transcriptional regulator [Clostridia bacterium]